MSRYRETGQYELDTNNKYRKKYKQHKNCGLLSTKDDNGYVKQVKKYLQRPSIKM